jgi:putative phosphoribosyl transferase
MLYGTTLFRDRTNAGERLAERIDPETIGTDPVVLGIPRGGIETGLPVALKLDCPLEPVTLRKLPVPGDDQMGFGAVTIDRQVILNQELVDAGYVPQTANGPIVDEVYREVQRRDRLYREGRPFPGLDGRPVVIVDDGLATGYTMLAAVRFARAKKAAKVIAAVPVAHEEAYRLIKGEADELICLHVDAGLSFAVASFYEDFPDMKDDEVLTLLRRARH